MSFGWFHFLIVFCYCFFESFIYFSFVVFIWVCAFLVFLFGFFLVLLYTFEFFFDFQSLQCFLCFKFRHCDGSFSEDGHETDYKKAYL